MTNLPDLKLVSSFILREEFHRRPALRPYPVAQWGSREQQRVTFLLGCWQLTALGTAPSLSGWGSSKLADHEELPTAGYIIPLALRMDFHTVLWLSFIAVVGLPSGPVGINQYFPSGVSEPPLRGDVIHAQVSIVFPGSDHLCHSLVLGFRAWGGQLSLSLSAELLCI